MDHPSQRRNFHDAYLLTAASPAELVMDDGELLLFGGQSLFPQGAKAAIQLCSYPATGSSLEACTLLSRIKSRVHTCISRWPHGFLTTLNPSINYLLPRPSLLFVPGPPAYSNPYRESSKRYGRSSEAYVVPGNH